MTNSMYVPLNKMPRDIGQLGEIIFKAFGSFDLPIPGVNFNKSSKIKADLFGGFTLIENAGDDQKCWISFSRCSSEISEKEGYNYIADIQTHGFWHFAGIAAYGLCLFSGYVVFNDSGALDGKDRYSAESLRSTLVSRPANS